MADNRQIIGFRSPGGVFATLFASLLAYMLSASPLENSTTAAKSVKAFWHAGLFLSVCGILGMILAQWFELLFDQEVETLKKTWSAEALPPNDSESKSLLLSFIDSAIAFNPLSTFPIVAGGVALFLVGLAIYAGTCLQPLLVSIV